MTGKRFMTDDCGTVIDVQTRDTFDYVVDVIDLLNSLNDENEEFKKVLIELKEIGDYQDGRIKELSDENEKLNQFPVKLENRIQKLHKDLQNLTEMDKSDLNPQAIEDVATVISISLNALMEFQKELME